MNSPFKFLDAYEQGDKDIFFGRGEEVERLYRLLFEANLVLLYGQSGTGKTSLIQCGLANRFQPTDWFQLFVRRQDDINLALDREIRAHAETPIPPGASAVEAVRSLYLDHLRPVYLIFDQFEELFILGDLAEQDAFIATIAELLASDVCCKIIISLREEYLAMLHRFEKAVPTLFNKRLRVEPMSMASVRQVIVGTTAKFGIGLEHGEDTAQKIADNLGDPRFGIQLAYLQVYLDRLYRRATRQEAGDAIVFTDKAVEETGKLGDLMESFLDEQTAAIRADLAQRHKGIDKDAVQHVLEEFATLEGTKQPMARAAMAARLPALAPWIDDLLGALQKARILRGTDEVVELAHDSLARRIAERRSGERKALLMVRRLVQDRMTAFAETRTWLNRDELAVVRRSRPRLELSEDETGFVEKSASKVRWQQIRWITGIAAAGLILLVTTAVSVAMMIEADDTIVRAHKDTEDLSQSVYDQLLMVDGTEAVRVDLLERASLINRRLGVDSLLGNQEDHFWNDLLQADLAWENDAVEQAQARYESLAREARADVAADPWDLLARIKLRGVLNRMILTREDDAVLRALNAELVAVLAEAPDSDLVRFDDDIRQACEDLRSVRGRSQYCPPE